MKFKDLTEEQRAEVKACKSPDEILKLAKDEGFELSDEELENMSGGASWGAATTTCPACGNKVILLDYSGEIECETCGEIFTR